MIEGECRHGLSPSAKPWHYGPAMSSDLLMTPQVSVQVSRKSRAGTAVMDNLADAKSRLTKNPDKLFPLAGVSGPRHRIFLNQLIGRPADARHLSDGCLAGSAP